jgi:shikimate kinase
MSVSLTGFMGTGKTTVGRLLAQRLRKPFIDSDERIEQLEGCSVATLFADRGEPNFRALERQVVADAVQTDAVVATGGGAIVDPVTYQRMHEAGPIVCLVADVETILRRTAADRTRPLLENGERRTRISQLLSERAAAYARADVTVDTTGRDVEAVLEDILSFLHPDTRHGQRERP